MFQFILNVKNWWMSNSGITTSVQEKYSLEDFFFSCLFIFVDYQSISILDTFWSRFQNKNVLKCTLSFNLYARYSSWLKLFFTGAEIRSQLFQFLHQWSMLQN